MTQARLREYESLLSRLRADPRLWTGERISSLIDRVKQHCAADWNACEQARKDAASERLLSLYA